MFYYKYYNYVSLVSGAEDKRHCIIYICIFNRKCVLCFFANLVMHLRDNAKVFSIRCANRMDRSEACPRRICCFCSKKSFLHDGSISWQKSPVKILFARKVQNGEAKCPHSGTLRREQNSPNSGTLLSASQTFPLSGESPRPTL